MGDYEVPDVGAFDLGSRIAAIRGTTVIGFLQPDGQVAQEGGPWTGLPLERLAIVSMAGSWPDPVLALLGTMTGRSEPSSAALYRAQSGKWAKVRSLPHTSTRDGSAPSMVIHRNALWLLAARSGSPDAALGATTERVCDGTATRALELEPIPLSTGAAATRPKVDASFVAMGLVAASGRAFVWGYDTCKEGVFVGDIDANPVALELLPGTEPCASRHGGGVRPALNVSLSPTNHGLLAVAASTVTKCMAPTSFYRNDEGVWTSRTLPGKWDAVLGVQIEPDGTTWLATDDGMVRIHNEHWTLLGFAESCAHPTIRHEGANELLSLSSNRPVDRLVSRAPGDVWLVVNYEQVKGLCHYRAHSSEGQGR